MLLGDGSSRHLPGNRGGSTNFGETRFTALDSEDGYSELQAKAGTARAREPKRRRLEADRVGEFEAQIVGEPETQPGLARMRKGMRPALLENRAFVAASGGDAGLRRVHSNLPKRDSKLWLQLVAPLRVQALHRTQVFLARRLRQGC